MRPGCIVETLYRLHPCPFALQLTVLASFWKSPSMWWPRSSMLILWLKDLSRKNVFYLLMPVRAMRGCPSVAPPLVPWVTVMGEGRTDGPPTLSAWLGCVGGSRGRGCLAPRVCLPAGVQAQGLAPHCCLCCLAVPGPDWLFLYLEIR